MFFRPVSNASEVMQIISSVLKLRAHCPTLVHADSSRSHLIVTLTVSSKSPNAVALGEIHVWEFIEDLFQWPAVHTFLHCNPFALPISPQATECQDGHAALHPEGVVESTLSPCQPRRPPPSGRNLCKPRVLSLLDPVPFSLPLPETQHHSDSIQDKASAGGPGWQRVCW